jgi:hypothetical protein
MTIVLVGTEKIKELESKLKAQQELICECETLLRDSLDFLDLHWSKPANDLHYKIREKLAKLEAR